MSLLNVMKNSEIFGKVMQDLVHEKSRDEGLNKTEIAEGLGIAPQTLSGYLKGKHIPEYARLSEIANFFNTSISFLLGESTEAAAPQEDSRETSDLNQLGLTEKERNLIRILRDSKVRSYWKELIFKIIEGAADDSSTKNSEGAG